MIPQALADAVLAPGHAPAVRATVHPSGMEAPSAALLGVDLGMAPRPAPQAGFCVSDVVRVAFVTPPEATDAFSKSTPARPARLSVEQDYALADGGRSGPCARAKAFFRIDPARSEGQLDLVRRLSEARRQASSFGPLSFEVTYANLSPTVFPTAATPRAALASLPLEDILSVDPAHDVRESTVGSTREVVTKQPARVLVGGAWEITVEAAEGRVRALHLLQRIPPPS